MRGLFKGGKRKKNKNPTIIALCYCVTCSHSAKYSQCLSVVSDRDSVIYTHPPLFLCNLCGMLTKGRGLPQYTQLYVTSRSIKMLPRFPLYLSFPFSLSVHLSLSLSFSSTCAQQPIHLMQFPSAIFIPATSHPIPFSPFPPSLSLPRCTGDVILFQLDSPPFSLPPLALALSSVPH